MDADWDHVLDTEIFVTVKESDVAEKVPYVSEMVLEPTWPSKSDREALCGWLGDSE
jgi:hypothetical protein